MESKIRNFTFLFALGLFFFQSSVAFLSGTGKARSLVLLNAEENTKEALEKQAQDLLSRARKLREEIGQATAESGAKSQPPATLSTPVSKWNIVSLQDDQTYRLYIDIGREDGTWMDARWGSSGRRIECTLDIKLTSDRASAETSKQMVNDNQRGTSTPVFLVETATRARLKGGFDEMAVSGGGYRIDNGNTLRFFANVEGATDGDVSIPPGNLYFSLPCFMRGRPGNNTQGILLSTKEGIISVRQFGWHTGWRREESRIVGVFRVAPIQKAKQVDGF